MNKIDIIIPVYNVASYLCKCLDSVIAQTYKDWRCICIDDGSTDASSVILDEYAAKDDRFMVIHQKNTGQATGRNNAIEISLADPESEWIAFVDSDDAIAPNLIEELLNGALSKNAEIAIAHANYVKGSYVIKRPSRCEFKLQTPDEFWQFGDSDVKTVPWGKLYRKALFIDVRYPAGRVCEDVCTTPRLIFKAQHIAVTDAKLYYYYFRQDGTDAMLNRRFRPDGIMALEDKIRFFKEISREQYATEAVQTLLYVLAKEYRGLQCRTDAEGRQWSVIIYDKLCKLSKELRGLRQFHWGSNRLVSETLNPLMKNILVWKVCRAFYLIANRLGLFK